MTDIAPTLKAHPRDVFAIARFWTLSSGLIARNLGRFSWLMLLVTYPVQLVTACAQQPVLYRLGRACCVCQDPSSTAPRRSRVFAVVTLPLLVAQLLAWMLIGMTLFGPPGVLLMVAVTVLMIIDAAGDVALEALQHWHAGIPSLANASDAQGHPIQVMSVAAYPRRRGDGTRLLTALVARWDSQGREAILDARDDESLAFYKRFSFTALSAQTPRRLIRQPS